MSEIDWVEVDASDVQQGMRVAPLANWTVDVHQVTPHGFVCMNLETGRAFLYKLTGKVHVLTINGKPAISHNGRFV